MAGPYDAVTNLANLRDAISGGAPQGGTTSPTLAGVSAGVNLGGPSPLGQGIPQGSGGWGKAQAWLNSQVGKPYIYGAEGPNGFDCTGLIEAAGQATGVNIPRTGNVQNDMAIAQQRGFQRINSLSQIQPGDVLYYGSSGTNGHAVVYVGNGQVIQAPHTGASVGYAPLFSSASASEPFVGAIRYW